MSSSWIGVSRFVLLVSLRLRADAVWFIFQCYTATFSSFSALILFSFHTHVLLGGFITLHPWVAATMIALHKLSIRTGGFTCLYSIGYRQTRYEWWVLLAPEHSQYCSHNILRFQWHGLSADTITSRCNSPEGFGVSCNRCRHISLCRQAWYDLRVLHFKQYIP